MSFVRLVLAATVSFYAASVLAADLGEKKPVLAPLITRFDWSGFYIGLHAGALHNVNRWSVASVPFEPFNVNGTSVLGGLQLGYRHQLDRLILGVEADASYAPLKAKDNCANLPTTICRTNMEWHASLRGRLGYAFDRLNLYATGGLAVAHLKFRQTEVFVQRWGSHVRPGWTLGAGAEYAVTAKWVVGAEYRYSDFGRKQHMSDAAIPIRFRDMSHQATLRASYKF